MFRCCNNALKLLRLIPEKNEYYHGNGYQHSDHVHNETRMRTCYLYRYLLEYEDVSGISKMTGTYNQQWSSSVGESLWFWTQSAKFYVSFLLTRISGPFLKGINLEKCITQNISYVLCYEYQWKENFFPSSKHKIGYIFILVRYFTLTID